MEVVERRLLELGLRCLRGSIQVADVGGRHAGGGSGAQGAQGGRGHGGQR